MWTRMAPPGRASQSQTGVVNPCGPHHCARCFGSVHILNTRARGASITRVSTSSYPTHVSRLSAFMLLLLCLQLADVVFKAIETLVPQPPVLLDPMSHFPQGLRLEPARTPLRLATLRNQAGPLQDFEVLGD